MAEFDPADAAMEGFRVARERPQVVPAWAALQLVLGLLAGLLGVLLGGEALNEFQRLSRSPRTQDEARMTELVTDLLPYFSIVILLNAAAGAVLSAAVFRAVLRPQDGGPGFLRFGRDEVRMFLSLAGVFALAVAFSLGVVVILALLISLLEGAGDAVVGVLAVLLAFSPIVALTFILTRLSLSLPQTFAERRVSIVGGWRLSRRRFWPLFGMTVLAIVLSILVAILAMLLYFPVGAVLSGGLAGANAPLRPDYASLETWFSPAMGAYLLIVVGFAGALINAAVIAPLAHAYRALAPREPAAKPASAPPPA